MIPRRALTLLAVSSLGWITSTACSLRNQDGPLVTCEDLDCGRINACEDGIIAQCLDGQNVLYHVCSTDNVCLADWQVDGAFRCEETLTDCEGCRPEREDGCDAFSAGGGGSN